MAKKPKKNTDSGTLHLLDGGGCFNLNSIDRKKKQASIDIYLTLATAELILSCVDMNSNDIGCFCDVLRGTEHSFKHEDFKIRHASEIQDPPILVIEGGDNDADFEIVLRPTEEDVVEIIRALKEVRKEIDS